MSRILAVIVSLLVGLVAGGTGVYYWRHLDALRANPPATAETGHEPHTSNDDHAGHADAVELSAEAIRECGIEMAEAARGVLETVLTLPGEITLNADRVAHIVPRVSGQVREVRKTVGDAVAAGEVLAVLESRELAEAKAADLSAEARLKLAESQFQRIEGLWKQKLSSEQQYQEALQALEEARIVHRETMSKLHALGLNHDELNALPTENDANFSRYELKAPFAATVVDKHAALGEVHDTGSDLFVLADLQTVWVDVTVYPQDVARVQIGSKLRVLAGGPDGRPVTTDGTIRYVSPLIRESTRTGLARAEIANPTGFWRPGLFVTAEIVTSQKEVSVLVPSDCIQIFEGRQVIFVAHAGQFEPRPVATGRSNRTHTEITSGLRPGEAYVTRGAVMLKAELSKGTGEHEH